MSELGLAGADGPSEDLLVSALQILLWLCSVDAPVPHSVQIGPRKTVIFGWQQGGATVEVHALRPGRSVWRAANGKGEMSESDRLDGQASQVLRSFIPLVRERPPAIPNHQPPVPKPNRPRGRPKGRRE